ncbi:hypothetical protein BDF19DRAFT_416244 [Syncephalis fuscata]|nr:hypothetical protein BDF19DRAFT_416244 [Syncephalis fuscata]
MAYTTATTTTTTTTIAKSAASKSMMHEKSPPSSHGSVSDTLNGPFADIQQGKYEIIGSNQASPPLDQVWFTFSVVPSAKENATKLTSSPSQSGPRGYTIRRRFMDFRSYGCLLCAFFSDNSALLQQISRLADTTICNDPGDNFSLPNIQDDLKQFVDGLLKLPVLVLDARPSMEFFGIWPSDLQASGNCVAFNNGSDDASSSQRNVDHPSLRAHRRSQSANNEPMPWMQRASMLLRPRKHRETVMSATNGQGVGNNRSRRYVQANKIGLPQLVVSSADITGLRRGEATMLAIHTKPNSLNAISGRLARALHRSRPIDDASNNLFRQNSNDGIAWATNALNNPTVPSVASQNVPEVAGNYSYLDDISIDIDLGLDEFKLVSRRNSINGAPSVPSNIGGSISSHSSSNLTSEKGNINNLSPPLGNLKQATKSQPNLTIKSLDKELPPVPSLQEDNKTVHALQSDSADAPMEALPAEMSDSSLDRSSVDSYEGDSMSLPNSAATRSTEFSDLLDLYAPLKNREPGTTIEELLTPLTHTAISLSSRPSTVQSIASIDEVPLKISVVQWRFKKPLQLFVPFDIDYATLYDVIDFELRKRNFIERDADDSRIMIWTIPSENSRPKRVLGDRTLSKEIELCNGELRLRCEISYAQPREHRRSRSVPVVGPPPKQARWRQTPIEQMEEVGMKSHYISKPKPFVTGLPQGRRPSIPTKLETILSNEPLCNIDPAQLTAVNTAQSIIEAIAVPLSPSPTVAALKYKQSQRPVTVERPSSIIIASKAAPPRKSTQRNRRLSITKTTPSTVGLTFDNNLKMATSGFEAHRRKRLMAATAAAAFVPSSSTTANDANKQVNYTRKSSLTSQSITEDETTQAVRFRVKKDADYSTLKAAVFRSLIREKLPAEALAGRTLVFRCPDGTNIPLTDDDAVNNAFKQCRGKVTLACI